MPEEAPRTAEAPQVTLTGSDLACDGCGGIEGFEVQVEGSVMKLRWAGERLLFLHDGATDFVRLVGFDTHGHLLWTAPVAHWATTELFADGDKAVVVEEGLEGSGLMVMQERSQFDPVVVTFPTPAIALGLGGGQFHIVRPRDTSTDDLLLYEAGAVPGPFTLSQTLTPPVAFPVAGPLVPAAFVQDQNAGTTTLRVELDSGFHELLAPSSFWPAAPVDSFAIADSGLFAVDQQPLTADLFWQGGQRHLGTSDRVDDCGGVINVPYPDVCPTERTALPPRDDVVLVSMPFVDDQREARVAYVLADVSPECSWVVLSGCFETLPCQCTQQRSLGVRSMALVVERVEEPFKSMRVSLPATRSEHLTLAARAAGGVTWVALADSDAGTIYALRLER